MVLIPLAIVAIGTVGYPLIEGPPWTLFDGLYMTVITLTTVGYGEIPQPISKPGRAFTMILALGGIFVIFYIASDIIRSIVTGELQELMGKERMDDRLKHLHGHMIVCGFGRMGKVVCHELERFEQSFVVIDTSTPPADWPFRLGLQIQGNATEDHILKKAGIERARALISAVGSDAENLYIALSARLLNPNLILVARAEEAEAEAKLKKVGVNKVISPYLTGGNRAVQAVLKPTVLHFMDTASSSAFQELQLEELRIEPGSRLAELRMAADGFRAQFGVTVIGVVMPNGDVLHSPAGETPVEPGAVVIVIGDRKNLNPLKPLASKPV